MLFTCRPPVGCISRCYSSGYINDVDFCATLITCINFLSRSRPPLTKQKTMDILLISACIVMKCHQYSVNW